jgi:hypothetical protein
VILLSTWVFELLEICTMCLGMLLGLTREWPVGVVFIAFNPQTSRWTESSSFLSSGAPDSPVHHRTDRCYNQRVPVCGLSAQTVRLSHRTVRCATRRWLTARFLGSFADFFALLLFLSIGLLCIFLCLLLRCCILIALVQFSSHPVNYNYKH